jgi:hypothetical protein
MQHMGPVSHQPNVLGCAIYTLAILNRPLEHVTKLGLRTQIVGSDKVHHTPETKENNTTEVSTY